MVRVYWWLLLALALSIVSWIGWMNERNDKLQQVERLAVEMREYRGQSSAIKDRILAMVNDNGLAIQELLDAHRLGLSCAKYILDNWKRSTCND